MKKQYSDLGFGEIFSSMGSPKQRGRLPEDQRMAQTEGTSTLATTTAKAAIAQGNQGEESHTINSASSTTASSGPNLLAGPIQKRVQNMLKGKHKRPASASAVTSPPKHHKVFDFPSGDDVYQTHANTRYPKGNNEFDVPSSSDEEATIRTKALPQRSSRDLSTSAGMRKFAREVKKGMDNTSVGDIKSVQNGSALKKQEKQTSTSKNIRATAKVSKSTSSSKASEASKPSTAFKAPTTAPPGPKQAASSSRMTSVTVEIKSVSRRSRVIRPQSRQLSPKPELLEEQPVNQPVHRTQQKSVHLKPQITSISGPPKSAATKHTRRVASVPLPVIPNKPSCLPPPPSLPLPSKADRRHSIPYSPSVFAHVDGLSNKSNQSGTEAKRVKTTLRFSEILRDEVDELPVPRRRRLIDRLGAGIPGTNQLISISSDSNDDSEEEYCEQLSHSIPQPQSIFDSQSIVDTAMEEQPQQFTTEPIMNPVYNNGRIGPKITYARQRSFRTEELDENALFNTPLVMAQQPFRGHRNTGLEDEELEGDTGSKMMKTIHELREAGVNNRFLDDIEELFGDIEGDSPLGRRRSR